MKRFRAVTVGKFNDGPARIRAIEAYAVADAERANSIVSRKYDLLQHAHDHADALNAATIDLHDSLSGALLVSVSDECISACSAQGSVDDACDFYVDRVVWSADLDTLRALLREAGAFDLDTADADERAIKMRALWILCCNESDARADGARDQQQGQQQTRAQQLADAFLLVAKADHYMIGIVEQYSDDERDAAEQILIDQSNLKLNADTDVERALDLLETSRRARDDDDTRSAEQRRDMEIAFRETDERDDDER